MSTITDATSVAKALAHPEVKISQARIYGLINQGQLRAEKRDGVMQFSLSELLELQARPRHLRGLSAADVERAREFGRRAAADAPPMPPSLQRLAAEVFADALAEVTR